MKFEIKEGSQNRNTAQKMKFSFRDFFRNLRIWSHLLKKALMENFIFCAVKQPLFSLIHISSNVATARCCLKRSCQLLRTFKFEPKSLTISLKQLTFTKFWCVKPQPRNLINMSSLARYFSSILKIILLWKYCCL